MEKVKFIWKSKAVPRNLNVKQVYGVAFAKDGRVLLRIEDNKGKDFYSLAGGRPEKQDKDITQTLKREFIEEVNTTLDKCAYIGYHEVNKDKKSMFAQVRMVAMIDEIGEVKPDPDNGETYKRMLVSPKRAIKLLNWGKSGKKMINQAVKVAKKEFGIKTFSKKEELV